MTQGKPCNLGVSFFLSVNGDDTMYVRELLWDLNVELSARPGLWQGRASCLTAVHYPGHLAFALPPAPATRSW